MIDLKYNSPKNAKNGYTKNMKPAKTRPRTNSHPKLRRIFVYGDSNVWGDNFAGARVRYVDRWVNRLARTLRGKARVIADGVPGRVAGDFRTDKPHKNGLATFGAALQNANHPDLIIIALGTNDLQARYQRTADDLLRNLLAYETLAGDTPVLYLLPPPFSTGPDTGDAFTERSEQLRRELLRRRHELKHCVELPAMPLSDGLHFSPKGHAIVCRIVKDMIYSHYL